MLGPSCELSTPLSMVMLLLNVRWRRIERLHLEFNYLSRVILGLGGCESDKDSS